MANGHIRYKIETGGGKDPDTGFPIAPVVTWSDPIPCTYVPNHSTSRGFYEGGSFTTSQYTIHVDMQELPNFDAIRLYDSRGNLIGADPDVDKREFSVTAPLEYLDLVNRIKIIV